MTSKSLSAEALRIKHSPEVRSLSAQLEEAKRVLENFKQDHGQISALVGDVVEAIEGLAPAKLEILKYSPKTETSSPCTVVGQITDVHYAKVQDRSEIEGFGEYNPEISKARQISFIQKIMDWTKVQRTAYNLRELVLLITGDMVSGDIHEDLKTTNAMPSPYAAVQEARILAECVLMAVPHFDSIRIEYIGEDNHGRFTRKPQATEGGLNNWNTVIAAMLGALLQNQSNVKVNWYPAYEKVIQVQNMKYLICHGHELKGWMGIPWYSIERQTGKEARKRMNAPAHTRFNKIVMGHWHIPFDSLWYSVGGSCSGTDALDHKAGRESPAIQTAWMVHPKHGEFNRTNFLL